MKEMDANACHVQRWCAIWLLRTNANFHGFMDSWLIAVFPSLSIESNNIVIHIYITLYATDHNVFRNANKKEPRPRQDSRIQNPVLRLGQ